MRKKLVIIVAAVLLALVAGGGLIVANDLSNLRRDVGDIDFKLGDMENALRGSSNADTLETVRRRIEIVRDDLRLLGLRHRLASAFFKGETQAVWGRFARVEQRSKAVTPRR